MDQHAELRDDGASVGAMVRLAVPLILGMAATSVMQFTDRWFLSRLGPEALAASMPASILAYVSQCLFSVAAAYVSTFAAQHHGACERAQCGASVWPAIWLAIVAGAINAALIPLIPSLFSLTHAEPRVLEDMATLGRWFLAGAFPATVLAAIGGFYAGTGRTGVVLALNGSLLAVNAALNALLIFGLCGAPALGVAGSGIGTCVASWTMAVVAILCFLSPRDRREFATWSSASFDLRRTLRFARFALPQGSRTFLEVASWTWFVFAVGRLGTEALAATNIVLNWNLLTYLPMIGLSQAIAVVVGRALGAGRPAIAASAARRGLALELAYAVVVGIAILAASSALISFFVQDQAVSGVSQERIRAISHQLIVIAALWGLGDAVNLGYSGALNGAGDTRWPMIASLVSALALLVLPMLAVIGIADATWRGLGIEPVVAAWIATLLFVTGLGAVMAWRFHRGPWRTMSVRA
jgi:multidrug resistance protein, MATE family